MDATSSPIDPDLLLAHAGFVRSVARSLLADESAVDDVVQQTWLTALERPPREPGALRRWLARVARSVVRESRRSDERRARREAASAPSEVDPDDPALAVQRLARMRALTDAVLELPPPYRDALVRRHLEELSPAEIARRDGVPVATIETRLKRARKQLREKLEGTYGIGREALALLVTGVKAGATWKAATLAAAAVVMLAGAATWRVVAAMHAPETAVAAASDAIGTHERAASDAIAPRDVGGDPLVAKVSEVEPRLEWPDEATLRRMEQRGRALFGGVVFAPDGSPCPGATVSFDGGVVATTDDRGAWRADVSCANVDEETGSERGPGFDHELVARKELVGAAIQNVLLPSRRIDLTLESGLVFSGTVVDFDEGTPIGGAELDLQQSESPAHRRTLHARADALGRFEFPHLRAGSVYVRGRAHGYDSNGFMGYDFSRGDMVVTYRLRRQFALRGRFVPWPAPGVAAARATVKLTTQSPHDSTNTKLEAEGRIDADGRFELPLSVCPRCWIEVDVGGQPFWKEDVDTNEERRDFDVGDVALEAAATLVGRFESPAGEVPRRASVIATVSMENGQVVSISAPIDAEGSFRLEPLPPGHADLFLGLGSKRIAALWIDGGEGAEGRAPGVAEIREGMKRDLGRVSSRATLLHGTVRDTDGTPMAFADLNESCWTRQRVHVGFFITLADEDGHFVMARDLSGIADDVVHEFEGRAHWYVQCRGHGALQEDLEWPPSRTFVRRDFVLSAGVALVGKVVDESGESRQYLTILATRTDKDSREFGEDLPRADGSFEIRGLSPGAYRIVVVDEDGAEVFEGIHPENGPQTLRRSRTSSH